jgi:hypothetical protein
MKYLTYTPWPGELNNTRMCFETSVVLAYLSQRCLVMPKEYRRHGEPEWVDGEYRPLHPDEYFDLQGLGGVVPLLECEDYDRRVATEGDADRIDLVFEPQTAVFCFPKIPAAGSPDAYRLRDFAVSRQGLLELTPEMKACRTLNVKSPTLEHFYAFFYFSEVREGVECKRLVRDKVRFRSTIIAAAEKVTVSLGVYCALHVRRNDFFGQYPEQNISIHRLTSNVLKRVSPGTRLYVASDEKDRVFFSDLQNHFDVFFLENFKSILPDDLPEASLACVEQMVCAHAQIFVGTKLSTFSAYITRLRGYYGAPDQNTYFTDGSPGSEMDELGEPLFSWKNWVEGGNPLWGREFREAWECW